ncbi:MAG: isopentenyl-diphosphate Delta-isomerase [Patescibacteria group bacterium]
MTIAEDQLILVDERDNQIGVMGKLETHEKGLLHRAFSIIVKNKNGEIMLQKRADGKYHSGGLWTNTCCGHPRDGEETLHAANRRLGEEMGFDCELKEITQFIYKVVLDKGLTEHEFLHVFVGEYDKEPILNPDEASDWKWMTENSISEDIQQNPNNYTEWFKILMNKL